MLVLSFRPGSSVMLGDEIQIIVLETDGHQVRVGFNAPDDVIILREHLYKQHQSRHQEQPDPECPACKGRVGIKK